MDCQQAVQRRLIANMTKAKREKYKSLYHLGDEGVITEWSVVKQGTLYLYVLGEGKEETFGEHQLLRSTLYDCKGSMISTIKAWSPTNSRWRLGYFFASKEDATEYLRLYRESQQEAAEPKEDKVVKIKHLMEQAYKSLDEARKLQESFDE